jgi:uncharacterized repeat protein (TIGR01451 family)
MQSNTWKRIGHWTAAAGLGLMMTACANNPDPGALDEPAPPRPEPEAGVVQDHDRRGGDGSAYADARTGGRMPSGGDVAVFPAGGESVLQVQQRLPEQVRAGGAVPYEVVVTNTSDAMLHDITVTRVIQTREQMMQGGEAAGGESAGEQVEIDMLMPGQSQTVQMEFRAEQEGDMYVCYMADYEVAQCLPVAVVAPELVADIQFVNADGEPIDRAYACDDVFVQYTLGNVGSGDTGAIQISPEVSEGGTLAGAQQRVDGLEAEQRVQSRPVAVEFDGAGQYTARVTASGASGEVQASDQLTVMEGQLELEVQAPGQEYVGRPVDYRVTVTNPGEYPTQDVVVQLPLPEGIRQLSATRGLERDGNSFGIGTLEAGESRSFTVRYVAGEPTQIEQPAIATGYCVADPAQAEIGTEIVGIASLQLEMIDTTDPVQVGQNTEYLVRVLNEGTAADVSVRLQGQLPEGFSFVAGDGPTQVTGEGRTITFGPIESLAPGEDAEFTIEARADEATRGRFQLDVQSETIQTQLRETEVTTSF